MPSQYEIQNSTIPTLRRGGYRLRATGGDPCLPTTTTNMGGEVPDDFMGNVFRRPHVNVASYFLSGTSMILYSVKERRGVADPSTGECNPV